jgi:hypothetical protein
VVTAERAAVDQATSLSALAAEALECIYQHRLVSTRQLHAMVAPHESVRRAQRRLARLGERDLVRFVRERGVRHRPMHLWYLTEPGAEVVEAVPTRTEPRRKVLSPEQAGGLLQGHTIAVNEVGLCFLRDARRLGHDFGWRSWRHELGHPITTGGRSAQLVIPDAVLGYPLEDRDERVIFHHAFIELDRGTIPVDALAHKLGRYARLYRHMAPAAEPAADPRPRWRERYQRFPRILVVLAGTERPALERRMRTAIALCETEPKLADEPDVSVSFCTLEHLVDEGPFRRVFIEGRNPARWVDWLGRAKAARRA